MNGNTPWPANENEVIVRLYRSGGSAAVRRELPHRSPGAIQQQACRLGVAKSRPRPAQAFVGAEINDWRGPVDRARVLRWAA